MNSTSKKIYYVIQHGHGGTGSYSGETWFGCSLQSAKKFDTVPALLSHVHYLDGKTGYSTWLGLSSHIVRVEETPGSETRKVLGEVEPSTPGTLVKYAIAYPQQGPEGNFLSTDKTPLGRNHWTGARVGALAAAGLFVTQSEALAALQSAAYSNGGAYPGACLVRVAVSQDTPTVVETVLA